ncbi:hypothetical protein, partial [Lysinibacillus sphaericus]|uniref:hypothetical protein n=1 Tax=Lysinibacillus sphaericus TaxID=1421 RepID=UPI001E3B6D31
MAVLVVSKVVANLVADVFKAVVSRPFVASALVLGALLGFVSDLLTAAGLGSLLPLTVSTAFPP